jgi:hypothetical protein
MPGAPFLPATAAWNYVYGKLVANINPGTTNEGGVLVVTPGLGSNVGGVLQSVASVGKSVWPNFKALPYVGVQVGRILTVPYSARLRHQATYELKLRVVVEVVSGGSTGVVKLDDANAALYPIIDDGAGNGIYPLLTADYTLGGNAQRSIISEVLPAWDEHPVKANEYIAYADITVSAVAFVYGANV